MLNYMKLSLVLDLVWCKIFIQAPNDCPSGIPGVGLKGIFTSERRTDCQWPRRGRDRNGGFQPMRTRQASECFLPFRRQVGDGREAASTGLYGTRLRGAERKHGKTIENGVCGLANHNIDIS